MRSSMSGKRCTDAFRAEPEPGSIFGFLASLSSSRIPNRPGPSWGRSLFWNDSVQKKSLSPLDKAARFLRVHDDELRRLDQEQVELLLEYLIERGANIWGFAQNGEPVEMALFVPTRAGRLELLALVDGDETIDPDGMFCALMFLARTPEIEGTRPLRLKEYIGMVRTAYPRCEFLRWYNRRRKTESTVRVR